MQHIDGQTCPRTQTEGNAVRVLKTAPIRTPAFVFDVRTLREDLGAVVDAAHRADVRPLFAMKSFSVAAGLREIAASVRGFAASSPYEARLACRILAPDQTIHLTSPGLRPADFAEIRELVDYVGFNSLGQWERFRSGGSGAVRCGLRVNPQVSFVKDGRYDPCRPHSKLGVPLNELDAAVARAPELFDGLCGLQFHNNADCTDLAPVLETTHRLLERLGSFWDRIEWVNLGGGYLFREAQHPDALVRAAESIRARGPRELFIEPGASIVRRAGFIVASVIDLFTSGGKRIAVLDTTVNHMPEIFEYQFEAWVAGDVDDGEEYTLAGGTCLAGDLFGEHAFAEPLEVGSRVIFPEMGAYSLVKANQFNGIALPTVYAIGASGEVTEVRRPGFDDFSLVCGE